MIFQWPAAQQANVITVAGPMPLSLPSTMLLAPGHHVIVGFAFWNTGASPVEVDFFTDASCQRFSRRLSVTIPGGAGQGVVPVFQQSHMLNLEGAEGLYSVPSVDAVISVQLDGYI